MEVIKIVTRLELSPELSWMNVQLNKTYDDLIFCRLCHFRTKTNVSKWQWFICFSEKKIKLRGIYSGPDAINYSEPFDDGLIRCQLCTDHLIGYSAVCDSFCRAAKLTNPNFGNRMKIETGWFCPWRAKIHTRAFYPFKSTRTQAKCVDVMNVWSIKCVHMPLNPWHQHIVYKYSLRRINNLLISICLSSPINNRIYSKRVDKWYFAANKKESNVEMSSSSRLGYSHD